MVCVPAFADSAESWQALASALASRGCEVSVLELPGFGAAPRDLHPIGIDEGAARIAAVARRCWSAPVTLVAHSVGSTMAVRAARQLADGCVTLISLEGNLTEDDAYFSGRAARYEDPLLFKSDFCSMLDELVRAGHVPASYIKALAVADATSMLRLGRDAAEQGKGNAFGREFRDLATPKRYLWAKTTTPQATRAYLLEHELPAVRLPVEHHWPWILDADVVAAATLNPS